jgi:hypothetical protein
MSLGTWDPDAEKASEDIQLDLQQLRRFIDWSRQERLDQLDTLLQGNERQALSGLMHLEAKQWEQAADTFDNDELLLLLRFFTLAENLPGWEAGESSPVIPLAKTLRQRGARLDRELLLWIRSVNQNRYLPYGPL